MTDLPESNLSGRALEESAEDLYENAPCGYFSTLPNGQFVKINRTFLEWTGFSRDTLLSGKRFQDLLTVAGKIYHDTHFGPLLQMQGSVDEIAFDIICSDGRTLPVLVNAVEVKGEAGKPMLNRATVFNASDRRKYERELLAARKRAEEIARAKADTLNMVSHDLRNLLAGIISATKRLQSGELPHDQQQRYLGLLRSSTESMMLLANNLLEVSRLEAGKMRLSEKPFELISLIAAVISPIVATAEGKGLEVRQRLDARIPKRLVADDIKLGQVLSNLLNNAVKFTDHGFVELSVALLDERSGAVELRFAVTDTGIGIDKAQISSVTDAFSAASIEVGSRYGGTGLGLSLTGKILDLHETELDIDSTPGRGTTVAFDIVLASASEPQSRQTRRLSPNPQS